MRTARLALALLVTLVAITLPGRQSARASGVSTLDLPFAAGPLSAPATRAAASPPGIIASAVAPSKSGTVVVSISHATGLSTLYLTLAVGTQVLNFTLPARDLTVSSSSIFLNTRGDLQSYGSIQMTWTQKTPTITKPPTNYCGGGFGGPSSAWVTYVNGKGSARLNLPCIGRLAPAFTGTDHVSAPYLPGPTAGYFKGIYSFVTISPSTTESVALEVYKSSGGQTQALLTLNRRYTAGILNTRAQQIHVAISNARALRVDSRLGSASLDLSGGPKPLNGTKLSWLASAVATNATKISTCKQTWSGGATRPALVSGTLDLQTCVIGGSFPDRDTNPGDGLLYSNAAKPESAPALKLAGFSPASNAGGVSTSLSTLSATFSNPMNTAATTATIQGTTSGDIQTLTVSSAANFDRTLTFKLAKPLQPATKYTVTLTATDTYKQATHATAQFTTGS